MEYKKKIFRKFHGYENCRLCKLLEKEEWEPHMTDVFNKYVKKTDVVLDCGAHIGYHTLQLSKLCQTVHAFECNPRTYLYLKQNVQHVKNVVINKCGLSDILGTTTINYCVDFNTGMCGLNDNPMGTPEQIQSLTQEIKVDLLTIDSLQIGRVNFMKIDVEGYERKVIDGAIRTIHRCKPVMVIEVWKNHKGETSLDYTKMLFSDLLDIYNVEQILNTPDYLFIPK
jgi:FkbM family methyltransferase